MIAPARRVSYRILLQIATSDAHSDELLRSAEVDRLSAQDRNLTTTLVLGTLRWQLALDVRIRALLARPEAKLSPEAETALRMGAYQLLHLDRVPAHAVVNDSVELVKHGKDRRAAGMVNAVLRRIQGAGYRAQGTEAPRLSAPELAAEWAHPAWMVERWARRYGLAATEAICPWDQEPAGATIRVTDPAVDLNGIETEPGYFLSCSRRVVRGDVGRSEAFRAGLVRIQDEASQVVAEIAAAAVPGAQRVMDTCAAPGGKTAILAERLPEAEITAVDVSRKRLDLMRERTPRVNAERFVWEVADAATLQLKPEWDLILCDVPCSGTGTIARNPEIRLRVSETDLARQHARPAAILRAGLAGLKPGGRLVYSTCSLEPEENEEVVAEVLRETPGFQVVPVGEILDQLAVSGVVTSEGRERLTTAVEGDFLRTLPGVHPSDGFFAAVVERRSH
ncbi:MAG: transcription antitermination factor NusB [Acidobacteriaceae bacterium]